MISLPSDYVERVYAGVLGKIIGVYVGRPFEGWTHERIVSELGEITYYVHERLDKPLIVVDDDISGTFCFLRAMPDHGNSLSLTASQIGQTWLNYLIEERNVLWWGGMGNSTEHTAYLRLRAGIAAPESGSMARNGRVVAEQIGAQIFIDGWGLISPGDPEQAAELARRAASVSHDGEAIYGAQVVAAMEAMAFVEPEMDTLLDAGVSVIPADCLIRRLIDDLRGWREQTDDWYECFYRVKANYGYDKYGGNCHMVPNHALIIMALLYSDDDFGQALKVVNTAGWDTDCNSGNVGCIMGIKNGLGGLGAGADWRGPVRDRMYIPTADGGGTVTDAVREAYHVVNIARALSGSEPVAPKSGARFTFDLPGALQGFLVERSPDLPGPATLSSVPSPDGGRERCLGVQVCGVAEGRPARIWRETFPEIGASGGYSVVASPTLYPGQTLRARLVADTCMSAPVNVALCVRAYGANDALVTFSAPSVSVHPGQDREVSWGVDVPVGCPIGHVGIEFGCPDGVRQVDGLVCVDWLTWAGAPDMKLAHPDHGGARHLDAWVRACSSFTCGRDGGFRTIQNEGVGLAIQGSRDWADYAVRADLTPHLATSVGLAARVQGLKRYYALLLGTDGRARLVRERDGTTVLAECDQPWELYRTYAVEMVVAGSTIRATVDGDCVLVAQDDALSCGGVALLVEEGRLGCESVTIQPV